MKTKILALTLVLFVAMIISCETTNEKANAVIGDWDVQWVTYPEEGSDPDPNVNLTMNGKMLINKNGKITIHAYGYEGCIFGADTLEHTLNWALQGDTLNLTNDGDQFGIPYIIKDQSDSKMKLQLVEDVFLFLTKR